MSDDFLHPQERARSTDDLSLDGMDFGSAREFVMAYVQTLHELRRSLAQTTQNIRIWEDRVKLAQERQRPDLEVGAAQMLAELNNSLSRLRREENQVALQVATLKENLKRVKNQFAPSINTDALLADLEMLVGEHDKLNDKFKGEQAAQDLDDLKKRLEKE